MKIKTILKNLYKFICYNFFKIIYGKISVKKNNDFQKNINIFQIKNNKILTYTSKNYKVYQIFFGRIYNDNVQNVGIINQNNIVSGPSYQQINGELRNAEQNVCVKNGTPRFKKRILGRTLNLSQGASGHYNYSHWLLDMLPKLKLYSEVFSFKDLDYIYLNKLNNFQKSSLDLLGLKNLKIIDSSKFKHIQCNELISTQHPSYFKGYILDEAQYIPEWIIHWLRESFLKKSIESKTYGKIFIDRSESLFKHCQIINHNETIEFLKQKGFEILKLEKLSFEEQVHIFKNAKIVVSAHGAGLTNLCFSSPNCIVIEIKPSKPGYAYQNKVYENISKINNLNYKLYSTEYLNNKNLNGDIVVSTKKLNDYLNAF
jgi:capsular polysaccharide biosynthesis protein